MNKSSKFSSLSSPLFRRIVILSKFNHLEISSDPETSQQKPEVYEIEEPYKSIISSIDNGWTEMGFKLTDDERLTVGCSEGIDEMVRSKLKLRLILFFQDKSLTNNNKAFDFMNKTGGIKGKSRVR